MGIIFPIFSNAFQWVFVAHLTTTDHHHLPPGSARKVLQKWKMEAPAEMSRKSTGSWLISAVFASTDFINPQAGPQRHHYHLMNLGDVADVLHAT